MSAGIELAHPHPMVTARRIRSCSAMALCLTLVLAAPGEADAGGFVSAAFKRIANNAAARWMSKTGRNVRDRFRDRSKARADKGRTRGQARGGRFSLRDTKLFKRLPKLKLNKLKLPKLSTFRLGSKGRAKTTRLTKTKRRENRSAFRKHNKDLKKKLRKGDFEGTADLLRSMEESLKGTGLNLWQRFAHKRTRHRAHVKLAKAGKIKPKYKREGLRLRKRLNVEHLDGEVAKAEIAQQELGKLKRDAGKKGGVGGFVRKRLVNRRIRKFNRNVINNFKGHSVFKAEGLTIFARRLLNIARRPGRLTHPVLRWRLWRAERKAVENAERALKRARKKGKPLEAKYAQALLLALQKEREERRAGMFRTGEPTRGLEDLTARQTASEKVEATGPGGKSRKKSSPKALKEGRARALAALRTASKQIKSKGPEAVERAVRTLVDLLAESGVTPSDEEAALLLQNLVYVHHQRMRNQLLDMMGRHLDRQGDAHRRRDEEDQWKKYRYGTDDKGGLLSSQKDSPLDFTTR